MKILSILVYTLAFGLYLTILFNLKDILQDVKETCKLLFNFKGVGEDDN